jgi:hypothetical protein
VYDVAPEAVNVAEDPTQIAVGVAVAVIVGTVFTIIETVFVEVQRPLEPVTVYVVETAGETTTGVPSKAPGFHVYVKAPVALKVAVSPRHIVVLEVAAVKVGVGFTIKVRVVCDEQPVALAPITV